jgi:GTP-dependent phosphoenolpyruvate carboxykinase
MQRASDFAIVQFALPDGELWPIALLLLDSQDRLHVRARAAAELATKIPPEDVEVVALSLDQIAEDARTESGTKVLETLEDRLSNTLRISDRQKARDTLDELYRQYITHRK